MTGGTVSGNTASNNGGGVQMDGGVFSLSGSPAIRDNNVGAQPGNVYLTVGSAISISVPLANAEPIGVTMTDPGMITAGLSGNGTRMDFRSEKSGYRIALTDG